MSICFPSRARPLDFGYSHFFGGTHHPQPAKHSSHTGLTWECSYILDCSVSGAHFHSPSFTSNYLPPGHLFVWLVFIYLSPACSFAWFHTLGRSMGFSLPCCPANKHESSLPGQPVWMAKCLYVCLAVHLNSPICELTWADPRPFWCIFPWQVKHSLTMVCPCMSIPAELWLYSMLQQHQQRVHHAVCHSLWNLTCANCTLRPTFIMCYGVARSFTLSCYV